MQSDHKPLWNSRSYAISEPAVVHRFGFDDYAASVPSLCTDNPWGDKGMANPKPTGTQLAYIVAGAVIGAVISFGILGIGGAVGGAIIGVGAALGAIPYSRAVQEHKKRQGG